jgi:hypothetical protein
MAGERELLEELPQALGVLALVRIELGVRPFEVGGAEHAGRPVARTGYEDNVEIITLDYAIQMGPDERQRRTRAPMTEQALLHVLGLQRLLEERVVLQVDHPDRQVIARAPPRIDEREFLLFQRFVCC